MIFGKATPWSYGETALLWELSKKGVSPVEIGRQVGKNEAAVREKAKELGIAFKEKRGGGALTNLSFLSDLIPHPVITCVLSISIALIKALRVSASGFSVFNTVTI